MAHPFKKFLEVFVPIYEKKFTQANKATWILETTGSQDAADLKAELDAELRVLLSDPDIYKKLLDWGQMQDPILNREIDVLIRSFKQNQIPKSIFEKIALKEASLSM